MEDIRVYNAMADIRLRDKSFTKREGILFTKKYNQDEVREIWLQGIEFGISEGLRIGSVSGQKIELYENCKNNKQKQFLDKFYDLAKEYNCAITYNNSEGMCVVDLDGKIE